MPAAQLVRAQCWCSKGLRFNPARAYYPQGIRNFLHVIRGFTGLRLVLFPSSLFALNQIVSKELPANVICNTCKSSYLVFSSGGECTNDLMCHRRERDRF